MKKKIKYVGCFLLMCYVVLQIIVLVCLLITDFVSVMVLAAIIGAFVIIEKIVANDHDDVIGTLLWLDFLGRKK